jgi:hypothetical protein
MREETREKRNNSRERPRDANEQRKPTQRVQLRDAEGDVEGKGEFLVNRQSVLTASEQLCQIPTTVVLDQHERPCWSQATLQCTEQMFFLGSCT